MYEYVKQNEEPIEIEYVEDEHEESRDFEPSFWWWNKRYFLSDFLRCHNNPWLGGEFPEYIHGMQNDGSSDSYRCPMFIELIGDSAVNIYKEVIRV